LIWRNQAPGTPHKEAELAFNDENYQSQTQFRFVKGRSKRKRQPKPQRAGEYPEFSREWRLSATRAFADPTTVTASAKDAGFPAAVTSNYDSHERLPSSSNDDVGVEFLQFSALGPETESETLDLRCPDSTQITGWIPFLSGVSPDAPLSGVLKHGVGELEVVQTSAALSRDPTCFEDDIYDYARTLDSKYLDLGGVLFTDVAHKYQTVLDLCTRHLFLCFRFPKFIGIANSYRRSRVLYYTT
jgi:hypothetical protein